MVGSANWGPGMMTASEFRFGPWNDDDFLKEMILDVKLCTWARVIHGSR